MAYWISASRALRESLNDLRMATLSSSPQSNSHPITTNSYNSEPSNPRCVFLSVECGCYLHCELRRRVIVGVGIWLLVRLWDNIFLYISAPTLLALFLHTHFYSLTCLYCNSPASGPHFPHLFCFVFFSLFSITPPHAYVFSCQQPRW